VFDISMTWPATVEKSMMTSYRSPGIIASSLFGFRFGLTSCGASSRPWSFPITQSEGPFIWVVLLKRDSS
jgi:hypothetical protein